LTKEKIGILLNDNRVVLLHNISNHNNSFEVDAQEFYKYIGNIKALIHTHKNSCEPSILDQINMSLWNFPWIIVSKNCVKAFKYLDFSVFEINVNTLIPQEFHNLLMQLL